MEKVHRQLRLTHPNMRGADVRTLQREVNQRLRARGQHSYLVAVDGQYGPQTIRGARRALFLLGVPLGEISNNGRLSKKQQKRLRNPDTRSAKAKATGKRRSTRATRNARKKPLRIRAYEEAVKLIGVMEVGGNNMGPMVMRIIRANEGPGPEPWCGDFMAWVYRQAGSTKVQRAWAAVRLMRGLAGVYKVRRPKKGDMVRFEFTGDTIPDHVGMFVRDLGNGMIETIEGNTGATGAVSDSTTGGDGVYRKQRPKSLVKDYLRVRG